MVGSGGVMCAAVRIRISAADGETKWYIVGFEIEIDLYFDNFAI